jgi:hypothetical protein
MRIQQAYYIRGFAIKMPAALGSLQDKIIHSFFVCELELKRLEKSGVIHP